MCNSRSLLQLVAAVALSATAAYGQSVISPKSGVIHYIEGKVYLDDQLVETKFGEFPHIGERSVFRTGAGRAEVLLTPGVFLRVGEDSAFRLTSNRLSDTRVELLEGSILVECAELIDDNSITVLYKDHEVALVKAGLYRFETAPAALKVYKGEARVRASGKELKAKRGRLVSLEGTLTAAKFDHKSGDALHRWSKRRAGYLSVANLSGARYLNSSHGWHSAGWYFNPYFGMFTYIPFSGTYMSPFGYSFWSPRTVYRVYEPPRRIDSGFNAGGMHGPTFNRDLGYHTGGRSISPSPSVSSGGVPASSGNTGVSSGRTSDSAVGRGDGGGGGRVR